MTIFDLDYYFYKSLRLIRSPYIRKRAFYKLSSTPFLLRLFAMTVLVVLVYTAVQARETNAVSQKEAEPSPELGKAAAVMKGSGTEPLAAKEEKNIEPLPYLTARSIYIIDGEDGEVLYAKNPDDRLAPASITKLVTAYVAFNNYAPEEVIATEPYCTTLDGNTVGLEPYEQWTVNEMIYGALVQSASDATCALANHRVSGEEFIAAMNLQAATLGMRDTHFSNSTGLDTEDHYSTARDIIILGRAVKAREEFEKYITTEEIEIKGRLLETTNDLLGSVRGVNGIKTGFTDHAGECLLFSVEREARSIIGVVLGSEDRFGEAEELIEYIYSE